MKLNKRSVALLLSLAVLLTVAVGATVAFLVDKGNSVTNTFTPSKVDCEVLKEAGVYTVKNTGDTQCYVRVAIVVTQKNGDAISITKPEYEPAFAKDSKGNDCWIEGADGYYYYTQPLDVAETTTALQVTVTAADGYTASVEILASAIQATAEAVKDWSNDTIAINKGELSRKS